MDRLPESNPITPDSPVTPEIPTNAPGSDGKKIRRRNKPSLSCETCTVKKTKCDRGRPRCLACVKRRSPCQYSELADLIEESHRALGIESPQKKPKQQIAGPPKPARLHASQDGPQPMERRPSRSSTGSSPMLLSNMPFSHPTASNIFKAEGP